MTEGKVVEEVDTSPRWYIVKSGHRQEKLARLSLRQEKIEVWFPMVAKTRKGETFGAAMFPNHLFVRIAPTADQWPAIFAARGVRCVLGYPGPPTPIADRVVDEWKAREVDGYIPLCPASPVPPCPFKAGEAIRVSVQMKDGAEGLIDAVFHEQIDSRRVLILIKLLGQSPNIAKADLARVRPAA